jgi:putative DNA primase/helicase
MSAFSPGNFQPTIAESERFFQHECPDARAIGGDQMESRCVMHDGKNPRALSINNREGVAYCHTRCGGKGWGMYQWVEQRYGLHGDEAWQYIYDVIGRATDSPWSLPFRPPTEITSENWRLRLLAKNIEEGHAWLGKKTGGGNWQPRGLYVYGERVKVRFDNLDKPGDKQMLWFEPGPNKGWARHLNKEKLTALYHEPEVLAAAQAHGVIVLANGEKARDRVKSSGWPVAVTCLPNGEKSWNNQYAERFQGAEMVYVACDNDAVGAGCGKKNAGALVAAGIPARVVTLPGLPESGDLWDWDELGHSFEEFLAIAKDSPLGDPADAISRSKPRVNGSQSNGRPPTAPPALTGTDEPDLTRFELNDTGNAQRLLAFCKKDIRYNHEAASWFLWNETWWQPALHGVHIRDLARDAMELTGKQANAKENQTMWRHTNRSRNKAPLGSMVSIAEDMATIPIEALDRYHRLIPCLNGTFDLDTGQLRPVRREDYFTRVIPRNYNPALGPPKHFLEVLDELMGGGPDAGQEATEKAWRMIEYLQKVFGYFLTGEVFEKAFFCFYGASGNNGKSTILTILENILGNFCVRINAAVLTNTRAVGDANRRMELALTRGARLVIAGEPPAGQKFDEALLKALTQGVGTITANFKFQSSFQFTPTAKILLETNEMPRIDTEDAAFLRRLHPILFPVQIPAERMRKRLTEELRPEYDQILTWMIEGARRWNAEGLLRPLDIERNVQSLREENVGDDGYDDFFRECCTLGPFEGFSCALPELTAACNAWRKRQGLPPTTSNQLSHRLRLRPHLFHLKKLRAGNHAGNYMRVYGITPNDLRTTPLPQQYPDDSNED